MTEGTLEAMAQASVATTRAPYGVLLARLGQEATGRFRRALRPLDLSVGEFIVLKQVQATGPTSQTALAEALGLDNSNLAGVTGALYARGLIERAREECDRRRYAVELTADGRVLLETADAAIWSGEDDLLGDLDESERAQLWMLLRRMADSIGLCPGTEAEMCAEAGAAAADD